MIKRLENKEVYNPIRDHIDINFQPADDMDEAIAFIVNDLKERSFQPKKSRGLVFVPTRKRAEEVSELLRVKCEDENLNYAAKIDFYHAGLEGTEREEKYDNFNNGDTIILVATKAFGMGMDIKNIHNIYHISPSSTFEDYLQEVGRAGRNKDQLHAAGYSDKNPIQTTCLVLKDDFKKLKDKLHTSQMTWSNLKQVRDCVFTYVKKFQKLQADEEKAFALPLDLLEQDTQFEDVFGKDTFFRVALYWLEKLKRIRLGVYTPTHLPIRLLPARSIENSNINLEDRELINKLMVGLREYQQRRFPDAETIMIDTTRLMKLCENKKGVKFYKVLFKAQKANLLILEREITLTPTKLRTQELQTWGAYTTSPIIEATFALAYEILVHSRLKDQITIDGEYLDTLTKSVCQEHFRTDKVYWKETTGKNNTEVNKHEQVKKLQQDFIDKRVKFAFKLIGFLTKIRHTSTIDPQTDSEHASIVQLVYNGYDSHNEWKLALDQLKEDLYNLIRFTSTKYIKENTKRFNIVDIFLELKLENKEEEHFQKLVFLSKALAYLKGSGALVPMGVELFILDTGEFKEKDKASNDSIIFDEFNESNKMLELRLLALECLSQIRPAEFDRYIKDYFKCKNLSSIINLLESKFGEDHENLKAFRTEALELAKDQLSEEQRVVYEASINNNLQVIAGPGSGKTHTLTLRVARLIQEEKIKPENILVLAYNRAVVVELKERLGKLFRQLGYGKLINRLKVFTFHGFCRYCLSQDMSQSDFDSWTPLFIEKARNEPGLISQKLGFIKYVFVDEFQDITNGRLKLLELIANPQNVKVCVIGDPNQSIYGYQRADNGDPMDPLPYYEKFKELYQPEELNLSNNYRSYPEILNKSEELLSRNESKFEMPHLKALRQPLNGEEYCHIRTHQKGAKRWEVWLQEILDKRNSKNKPLYNQVAVMFRSNNEVFRAYNSLKSSALGNVKVRIQGSKTSPFRSREFHHFYSILDEKRSNLIDSGFLNEFKELKQKVIELYPNWDAYLIELFHCLVMDFEKEKEENATYEDLLHFITDTANKDDGQIGKIYQNNIRTIKPDLEEQELVLTTMHKVKGIEYDAVIIPPSFSSLPLKETDDLTINDCIEEERRLYYVAYTRAKYNLVVIKHKREQALDEGRQFTYSEDVINTFGIPLHDGIDKFYISWGAGLYGSNAFALIKNEVKVGDPVSLQKRQNSGYTFWEVFVRNRCIGQLNPNYASKIKDYSRVNGFYVSSVERYTYQETVEYDSKNNKNYASKWSEEAKNRGYIYLVDFSGYGKPS